MIQEILATLLGVLRTERIEESESEEPLQSTPFILFLGKSKTISPDGGKRPVFMTERAVDIGTFIQDMIIPSYLSSETHLQQFPDHKFLKLNSKFPSRSLRKGS